MQYTQRYDSPLGEILLAADDQGLTGLWFAGQKYFGSRLEEAAEERPSPVLEQAGAWLDRYFAGQEPGPSPALHLIGTPFQIRVWERLLEIPCGETTTYGALAAQLGLSPVSARAVGSAVGRNPVSVIVPCHRVLGAGGSLTGYAGGLERKRALLTLEGAEFSKIRE